jgi:hypothetical protein
MRRWLAVLAVAAAVSACASARPFVYENDRDLKPGPGLFSGEDGVFMIYGAPESPPPANTKDPAPAEPDQTVPPPSAPGNAGAEDLSPSD